MEKLVLAVLLGGALVVGAGDSALAADEKASCVGIVISEHARWGDQPGVVQGVKDYAQANDTNLGSLLRGVARAHLGSHAACGG